MIEDYVRVVHLKNKDVNPTGQCNWQCYIDRYPSDTMNTWDEAKANWSATGKAAGRNCRCDEVHSIKITFRIRGCEDYPIISNPELPLEYPALDGFRIESSVPRFIYYEEPIEKPNKILVKDLSDRFFSSAPEICPLIAM